MFEDAPSTVDRVRDPFVVWMIPRIGMIKDIGAEYQGVHITPDTIVTRFETIISYVIGTYKFTSKFYVVGHDGLILPSGLRTLASLLFGWWSLDRGIVWTISAVWRNSFGGRRRTVHDLILELTNHAHDIVRLTVEGAELARARLRSRGFPPDTALYVGFSDHRHREFVIKYDLPDSDGRQWRSVSEGVTIMIDKETEPEMKGLVIDARDGAYLLIKDGQSFTVAAP